MRFEGDKVFLDDNDASNAELPNPIDLSPEAMEQLNARLIEKQQRYTEMLTDPRHGIRMSGYSGLGRVASARNVLQNIETVQKLDEQFSLDRKPEEPTQ